MNPACGALYCREDSTSNLLRSAMPLSSRRRFALSGLAMLAAGMTGNLAPAFAQTAIEETKRIRFASDGNFRADRIVGDPNAPVQIIEYASLTCPHCAAYHRDVYPTVEQDFIETGKVVYAFRHFPLDRVALQAALLIECAPPSVQVRFLKLLLDQQSVWVQSPDSALPQLALLVNLNTEQVGACYNDTELQNHILRQRQEGINTFKVNSTPSIYVNGERVRTISDSGVRSAIEDAL